MHLSMLCLRGDHRHTVCGTSDFSENFGAKSQPHGPQNWHYFRSTAFSKSAGCHLWRFDHILPDRNYITIMMKLLAWHLSSDRVRKKNYVAIFGGNMHQLWGKQTGLYEQISAVNKIDSKAFQMHWTTLKPKALQSLTHNKPFYSCVLSYPAMNASEAWGDVWYRPLCFSHVNVN